MIIASLLYMSSTTFLGKDPLTVIFTVGFPQKFWLFIYQDYNKTCSGQCGYKFNCWEHKKFDFATCDFTFLNIWLGRWVFAGEGIRERIKWHYLYSYFNSDTKKRLLNKQKIYIHKFCQYKNFPVPLSNIL